MPDGLRLDRLPLTYDECRARFRRAATDRHLAVEPNLLSARGPESQSLTIDVTRLGARDARRFLVVMSGVHGVEGFIGSTLQSDALLRWEPDALPPDVGIVMVHAVNPWGMAWGRRQNEANVDLNRNWRRDSGEPRHNDAYAELHDLACPNSAEMPSVEVMLAAAAEVVNERGLAWVRDAITVGQYSHADGLHYGGSRTEASNLILERVVHDALEHAERVLTIDLHTGHGPRGAVTLLSDQPPGSPQDQFFRARFDRVEATADNPDATT
jgi:hypothetical protein